MQEHFTFLHTKMDRYKIYMDIMTGEILSSISVATMELIFFGQFGHPVGGERLCKGNNRHFSPLQVSLLL